MILFYVMCDWLRVTLAAVAVLWLPGRVMAETFNCPDRHRINLATSMGLSMAGTPLAAMFLSLLQIRVNRTSLISVYILCGAVILLKRVARHRAFLSRWRPMLSWSGIFSHNWSREIWLLVVFIATLALRFIQIRDLVLPAWVDSLHHTFIVQTIRDQGQIPDNLVLYTSIPFYYHFGFHTLTAAFGELANLSSPQAVLIFGQILNASVVFSVYQLAVQLTYRRDVGIAAAILTGLVSQMPAYYVSWGRYTLLAGMTLLPIAMSAAVEIWRNPGRFQGGLLLVPLLGGLILTHYLTAAYYFCFLLALALTEVIGSKRDQKWYGILVLSAWSVLGLVIVAPWIIRVFPYVTPFVRVQTIASAGFPGPTSFLNRAGYLWHLVNRPRSWAILFLALPVAVVSLARRRLTRVLVVWGVILGVLSNEWLCQVWPFRADLTLICLFLPVNILAAKGLLALQQLIDVITRFSPFVLVFILIALSVWGFLDTVSIIKPATVLTTQADVEALAWIQENIPSDARFLINVKRWQGNVYRGTDGGWWIPLLSHRATVLPPGVLYAWGSRRYRLKIKEIAEQVREIDGCTSEFWKFVQEQHITHIYIGAKGGTLQARWFDTCTGVRRVYMGYNVHIYKVRN